MITIYYKPTGTHRADVHIVDDDVVVQTLKANMAPGDFVQDEWDALTAPLAKEILLCAIAGCAGGEGYLDIES